MTEQLIKLINENKSLSEISEITKLSRKQLFIKMSMLRQSGYLIDREYSCNGEINYSLSNPFKQKDNKLYIKADEDITSIRMILTSDSHYGNINENLKCTDKMFDYCVKENINLIFHTGDFFEGVLPERYKMQKYNSTQEQIQETLSKYPYVPNILTITCLGNHDASFWIDAGIDIKTILENRRHDIIPVGYEQGIVKINNYKFILRHPIDRINLNTKYESNGILLFGHCHKFELNCQSQGTFLRVNIPSSSDIIQYNKTYINNSIPSIIDAEFTLNNTANRMVKGEFKQYILINNQLVLIGEYQTYLNIVGEKNCVIEEEVIKPKLKTCFDIIDKKQQNEDYSIAQTIIDVVNEEIVEEQEAEELVQTEEYEEHVEKPKTKVLTNCANKYQGMNQVEKFNMKYSQ